jgi:hypothetical protein
MSFLALFYSISATFAQEVDARETAYLNGGIGQEEAEEMRAKAGEYNIRLYLSEGHPAHAITDAQVSIADKKGNVKLDLVSGGPMLFLHLKNGIYKIIAKYNGATITRNAIVSNHRGINIYINWKNSGNDIDKNSEDTLSLNK